MPRAPLLISFTTTFPYNKFLKTICNVVFNIQNKKSAIRSTRVSFQKLDGMRVSDLSLSSNNQNNAVINPYNNENGTGDKAK